MIKQKFKRGSEVRICDTMPNCMQHFECKCDAIVEYTYDQEYGGGDIKSYSLLLLEENGEPRDTTSWYNESQLTLIGDDTAKGLAILEKYNYGDQDD